MRRGEFAPDDRAQIVFIDRLYDPEIASVGDEVAYLGDIADVVDLPSSGEVERDAHLGVTHGGEMPVTDWTKRTASKARLSSSQPRYLSRLGGPPRSPGSRGAAVDGDLARHGGYFPRLDEPLAHSPMVWGGQLFLGCQYALPK